MYVKLNDKGGLFHDASQDASVTGPLPVEVKKTKRVASALKDQLLVAVPDTEAKKILAEDAAARKELVANSSDSDHIKGLEGKVATLEEELSLHVDIKDALDAAESKVTKLSAELKKAQDDLAKEKTKGK